MRPLALTPTHGVGGGDRELLDRGRPAAASSSAASRSADESPAPATSATTWPGAVEKVASHSSASSAAMRPDEPAPT